jgi:large subunit ribosomal protein L22
MDTGKATLTNYRQSPRKVRLLADMVRGKEVHDALKVLRFTPKRGSLPMIKLIESAWANVKNEGANAKDLFRIAQISVDQGLVYKRSMPRARGRAFPIKKRCSHVAVVLERMDAVKPVKKEVKAEAPKVEKKEEKPVKKAPAKKKVTKE